MVDADGKCVYRRPIPTIVGRENAAKRIVEEGLAATRGARPQIRSVYACQLTYCPAIGRYVRVEIILRGEMRSQSQLSQR